MKQATEEKRKILLEKQTQKVKRNLLRANKIGYYPKIRGYQICSKCLKKKVGSLNAWFQDFTGQKRICYNCIKFDNWKENQRKKEIRYNGCFVR